MKRVSWVVLLCALFALFASPGWAGNFTTLQSLITQNTSGTVTLNDHYSYDSSTDSSTKTITISKNITIIGNGKTITGTNSNAPIFKVEGAANGNTVVIEGLTITGGTGTGNIMANASTNTLGGGIQAAITGGNKTLNLTVRNCTFTDNTAVDGGGIGGYTEGNNAKLVLLVENCYFKKNTAHYGGGIYNLAAWGGEISFDIVNSSFDENGTNSWGLGAGAGMANEASGYAGTAPSSSSSANGILNMTAKNCIFYNNGDDKTAYGGGAFQSTEGGAVSALFENCLFDKNKAKKSPSSGAQEGYGGGFISIGGGTASDTLTLTLKNCTFTNNVTGDTGVGGGFCNWQNPDGSLHTEVINCTFTNNTAGYGGGLFNRRTPNTKVTNCTFVGNTAKNNAGGAEVHIRDGAIALKNTILWNATAANIAKTEHVDNNATSTFNVTNCAYPSGTANLTEASGSTNLKTLSWSSRTSEKVKVNNIEHTVYKLTASDTALITGGTATGAPTTDQLGYTRSTTAPSIGAVEYIGGIKISTAKALPSGTVKEAYSQSLEAAFDPAQTSADLVWSLKSGSTLPAGLALSDAVISGEPTTAGDYTFTLTVTGSGDMYSSYSAEQDFTLTINPRPAVSLDVGVITIASSGGSPDITITLTSADYSDLAKTTITDLTSFNTGKTLNVASSDQSKASVTITPNKASVVQVLCGTAAVTVTDNKFTPSTAGTYKITFKGTDANDIEKYFAASFTYDIIDDTEEKKEEEETAISSQDVVGEAGNYTIKEGTVVSSDFLNSDSAAQLTAVNNFFNKITTTSNLATMEEINEILSLMGDTASDVGDETSGYKIIGTKLSRPVAAKTPFLVILMGSSNEIYIGIGVTQTTSDVFVIKFELLQDASNTYNKLKFPRGTYTVGATDSDEHFNAAELAALLKSTGANGTTTLKSASVLFLSEETGDIGDISFGELTLAGTTETTSSRDSSSSGCDAGLSGAAVLALVALALIKRKF